MFSFYRHPLSLDAFTDGNRLSIGFIEEPLDYVFYDLISNPPL